VISAAGAPHPGEPWHRLEHALAGAEGNVLFEPRRAVGARVEAVERIRIGLREQGGRDRCIGALAAERLHDPPAQYASSNANAPL
jgi:hypothetical protein